jgi:NAD-dependent dihydropyrimidine dehydrogenase PreA subunit
VDNCQFGALSLGALHSEVDFEKCMGCGVCVDKCQVEAISLKREAGKGAPLEILALMEKAAS